MAIKTQLRVLQLTGSFKNADGFIRDDATVVSTLAAIENQDLSGSLSEMASAIRRIHGAAAFTAATAGEFSQTLLPATDDQYDLGSATKAWQDLFLEGDITFTDAGTIQTTAGDITVDSAGDIILDAAGADIVVKDDGTAILKITGASDDVVLAPQAANKDIIFKEDGGTEIMRLDSSAESLLMASGKQIQFGSTGEYIQDADSNLEIVSDGEIRVYSQGDSGPLLLSGSHVTLDAGKGTFTLTCASRGSSPGHVAGGSLNFSLIPSAGPTITPDDGKDLGFYVDEGGKVILNLVDGGSSATDHEVRIIEGAKLMFANSDGASEFLSGSNSDILMTARAGIGIYAGGNSSRKLLLDGVGGIDIGAKTASAVDLNATTFDLDASGLVTIDAGGTAMRSRAGGHYFRRRATHRRYPCGWSLCTSCYCGNWLFCSNSKTRNVRTHSLRCPLRSFRGSHLYP